jgi:hypothetical protein
MVISSVEGVVDLSGGFRRPNFDEFSIRNRDGGRDGVQGGVSVDWGAGAEFFVDSGKASGLASRLRLNGVSLQLSVGHLFVSVDSF